VPAAHAHGAAYPLRVTGFSLQYVLPKHREVPVQLVISAIRAAPGGARLAGPPALLGPAGERLKSFGSASPPGTYGVLRKEPVVTPAFIGPAGLTLDFTSGSGYGAPVRSCGSFPNEIPCGPPGILPSGQRLAA